MIALVFILIFIGSALAQDSIEDVKKQVGDVEKYREIIADEDARLAYLNQSWAKLLNNTSLGVVFMKVEGIGGFLSPFFELVLGMGFVLSWHFFLTFSVWILLLYLAFSALAIFYVYIKSEKIGRLVRWGIFLLFFVAVSTIRISRFVSLYLIGFISKTGHWAFQLILIVVIFAFLIFLFIYAGMLRKQFSKLELVKDVKVSKEKVRQQERENRAFRESMVKGREDVKSIEEEAEGQAREDVKGMSEGN